MTEFNLRKAAVKNTSYAVEYASAEDYLKDDRDMAL